MDALHFSHGTHQLIDPLSSWDRWNASKHFIQINNPQNFGRLAQTGLNIVPDPKLGPGQYYELWYFWVGFSFFAKTLPIAFTTGVLH